MSLVKDPNLMITISLTNILIMTDTKSTPWTNSSLVGVPNNLIYNNKPTADCKASSIEFINAINNLALPFTFDYAVAIMK